MFGVPTEVIVTFASAIGSWWMKKSAQDAANIARERELQIQVREQANVLMDSAAKRSSPWLRKFAAITILLTFCVGLLLVSFFPDINVSIPVEVPQKSFLFGLLKWGKGIEVIEATGFVLPDWVKYSICAIVGFLFGPGFAKTK
jgi:hypothetical protein